MVNDDWQSQMERYLTHFNRAGKRQTILFTQSARPMPAWTPALDMYETQDAIVVLLDLAGVDAEQTEVHTQPHLLTVRGARRERHAQIAAPCFHPYHAAVLQNGREADPYGFNFGEFGHVLEVAGRKSERGVEFSVLWSQPSIAIYTATT